MKNVLTAVTVVCFVASAAFAHNPPPLRGAPPKTVRGPAAEDVTPGHPDPTATAPANRDYRFLSGILSPAAVRHPSAAAAVTSSPDMNRTPENHFRYGAQIMNVPGGALNPVYGWDVSNIVLADVEPANIAITKDTGTYHVSAYAHWDGSGYINRITTTTTQNSLQNGPYTPFNLLRPTGYSDCGDSWLAENPYSLGAAPGRLYATAICFNRDQFGNGINPSHVRIWVSDNGGTSWTNGIAVDLRDTGSQMLDKPVTDVSWYSGTLGHLFVGYIESGSPQRFLLRRNTGGLITRCRPAGGGCIPPSWDEVEIANTNIPFGPQVVVNSNNGDVYVFWTNSLNQILMRRSTDDGLTFAAPIVVANNYTSLWTMTNGMRAPTLPHARFNPVTGNVMLTWHGTDAGSMGTAIFYTTFDATTLTPQSPVPARLRIDDTGDQFQPAIDNDDYGNALIAYYSSPANTQYQLWGVYVTPALAISSGPSILNTELNDNHYSNQSAVFIGDYHDNFLWNMNDVDGTRWETSWTSFHNPADDQETRVTGVR